MEYPVESLSRLTLLAHLGGATVSAVDADGVVLASCGYEAGPHRLAVLAPLFAGADRVLVTGGDTVEQAGRGAAIRSAMHRDTGANPTYAPRSAHDPSVRAELLMRAVTKRATALERRFAAMKEDPDVQEKASHKADVAKVEGKTTDKTTDEESAKVKDEVQVREGVTDEKT